MSKTLCIHHNDSDGKLSAAIITKLLDNVENIEVSHENYKDKLKHILKSEIIPTYKKVFIVDFSLEEQDMTTLIKNYNVIWCDHHISAKNKLSRIWNSDIKGLRDINMSGAKLVNEYFIQSKNVIVDLVDDYDRWIFKYGEETKWFAEVNKGWTIDEWIIMLEHINTLDEVLEEGKFLYNLKVNRVNKLIPTGKDIIFKGYKTLLINNSNFYDGSLLGNNICKNGYDIALKYSFDKDNIIFGLNSIGDIDVSKIAIEYNGGGHKNASGFHMNLKDGLKFLLEVTDNE